jgi:hypothetical protein
MLMARYQLKACFIRYMQRAADGAEGAGSAEELSDGW